MAVVLRDPNSQVALGSIAAKETKSGFELSKYSVDNQEAPVCDVSGKLMLSYYDIKKEDVSVGFPLPVPTTLPPLTVPSTVPTASLMPSTITPNPTPAPSSVPTHVDTVGVFVSLVLTASAEATESDKKYLKGKIASSIGVQERNLRDFVVTSSSTNRRLAQTSLRQRRNILAVFSWTTSFDVVVSLAEISSSVDSEFVSSITSSLTDGDFISDVASQVGAQVDATSLVTVLITRQPTLNPSNPSTLAPTSSPTNEASTLIEVEASSIQEASADSDGNDLLIFGTIIFLGVGLISIATYCCFRRSRNSLEGDEDEDSIVDDADGHQNRHNSKTPSASAEVFQAQHLPSAELNQLGANKAQESSLPDEL